jgi:hypothetical protein
MENRIKHALLKKSNKVFLQNLYLLPKGTIKSKRAQAIRKGTIKQRRLLVAVLHSVMSGSIPMRKSDFPLIQKKLKFLNLHFQTREAMYRLLKTSDAEIKDVLSEITNFHVLLRSMFK